MPNSPTVSKVQFAQDIYLVGENSGSISIEITLQRKLSINSKVAVKVQDPSAEYGIDYLTEPALVNGKILVPVEAGTEKAIIQVFPAIRRMFPAIRRVPGK